MPPCNELSSPRKALDMHAAERLGSERSELMQCGAPAR